MGLWLENFWDLFSIQKRTEEIPQKKTEAGQRKPSKVLSRKPKRYLVLWRIWKEQLLIETVVQNV